MIKKKSKSENLVYYFCLIGVSIFINQGSKCFGMNFSFADMFLCIILIHILISRSKINIKYIIFFCICISSGLVTSYLIVPSVIKVYPNDYGILIGWLKTVLIFIYFLVGYTLENNFIVERIIKYFSYTTVTVGTFGIMLYILKLPIGYELFYYKGTRLRGLMIDPNFFGILQICGLVFFIKKNNINKYFRFYSILILIFSIILTGSKTGFITLGIYFLSIAIQFILSNNYTYKSMKYLYICLIIGFLFLIYHIEILEFISTYIPIFSRVEVLFSDFNLAISTSGSSRNEVIRGGIDVILTLPLSGSGVGNYHTAMRQIVGFSEDAHNTFIQLYAEYGVLLATFYYGYLAINIVKSFKKTYRDNFNIQVLRDIICITLIGSMALSLDNARYFWFLLGVFLIQLNKKGERDLG